jgi:hypothetical protein
LADLHSYQEFRLGARLNTLYANLLFQVIIKWQHLKAIAAWNTQAAAKPSPFYSASLNQSSCRMSSALALAWLINALEHQARIKTE